MGELQELFEKDVLERLVLEWQVEELSEEFRILKEAIEKGVPFEGTIGQIRIDLSTTSELARSASTLSRLAHNRIDALEKHVGYNEDNRIPKRKKRWWERTR